MKFEFLCCHSDPALAGEESHGILRLKPQDDYGHFSLLTFNSQRGLPATPSQAMGSGLRGGRGQSLIEVILAIALSAVILPALLVGLVSSRDGKAQQGQRTQALYLLNEGIEAVRSIREKGWTEFSTSGTFHPVVLGSAWSLAGDTENIDGFTRGIDIENARRDISTGEIVTAGGVEDQSTKKINVSVFWGQPVPTTVDSTLYVTRYLDNDSFVHTTKADFDLGQTSDTITTENAGGEVTLASGGGNWCAPNLLGPTLDLPGDGVTNVINAIEGKIFIGTSADVTLNDPSSPTFADIDVSNDDPPILNIGDTFGNYKVFDVFGEQNYAYIATNNPSKEIVILDLNQFDVNGEYLEIGYFNSPGSYAGNSVFVSGNIGYMTSRDDLYSFDLSAKNGSRTILDPDGIDVGDQAFEIFVAGNYAYVVVDAPGPEFQIVNVTNPANLVKPTGGTTGGLDIGPLVSGEDGIDVFVNLDNPSGPRAYMVATYDLDYSGNYGKADFGEFFIINISNPASPSIISTYQDANNGLNPKGLTVIKDSTGKSTHAIIVGEERIRKIPPPNGPLTQVEAEEYQVINISNENSPVRCGGLEIESGITDVYSLTETDGDAYSYITSKEAASELKVIRGGFGGGGGGGSFAESGEFTSYFFEPLAVSSFNRFEVNADNADLSTIDFQIASANYGVTDCSDAVYNFVGPDLTGLTYFSTAGTTGIESEIFSIPWGLPPGKCLKYKAFLKRNGGASAPVFHDIRVNYSP